MRHVSERKTVDEPRYDQSAMITERVSFFISFDRLFLSRGADIDIMNREGDTPVTLARPDTPVWVALQINRKLKRGITNRIIRTERIICR